MSLSAQHSVASSASFYVELYPPASSGGGGGGGRGGGGRALWVDSSPRFVVGALGHNPTMIIPLHEELSMKKVVVPTAVVYDYPKRYDSLKPNFVIFSAIAALCAHFLSVFIVLYCSSKFIRNGGFDDIVTEGDSQIQSSSSSSSSSSSISSSSYSSSSSGYYEDATEEVIEELIIDKIVSRLEAGTISRLEFGFCDSRSVYWAWMVFFIVGILSVFLAMLSGYVKVRDYVMCYGRSDLLGCYESCGFLRDRVNKVSPISAKSERT